MDHDKFERVEITSADDLLLWLEKYHKSLNSVWLVTWKAAHPERYVSRDTVLDALIAYGWIDGRRRKLDDIADSVVAQAVDGNLQAAVFIAERLDGKAPQTVDVGDNLASALEHMSLAQLATAASTALAALNQPEPLTITASEPESA